ncbi:hypothetical protein ACWEPL_05305, partial [Nonomuraea sp. NPDC004186]
MLSSPELSGVAPAAQHHFWSAGHGHYVVFHRTGFRMVEIAGAEATRKDSSQPGGPHRGHFLFRIIKIGPHTEVISANSRQVIVLEVGEDKCCAGDVADSAGADG